MANATIFDYQLLDKFGTKSRSSAFMAYNGATTSVDSLIGSWLELGGLIDPVVDAQITQGRITIPLLPAPTWKVAPADGNGNVEVMSLNFNNDFNTSITPLLLPSYKEALLNPDNTINLALPALAGLIDFMIDGGGDIFPNTSFLHDLNALRDAFLTGRKVRGQRQITRKK